MTRLSKVLSRGLLRVLRPVALLVALLAGLPMVSLAAVGTNCVATWTPPTTNTDGSAITGPLTYNLYISATPTPPISPTVVGVTAVSSALCKGLAAGAYNVWVTAVESFGGSTSESALSTTVPFVLVIPGSVTGVTVK